MSDSPSPFAERILAHQDVVRDFLQRNAQGLKRYDRQSDVFQDVCARALQEEEGFEMRSEPEFVSWLLQIARRHVADRNRHFRRLKRDAGPLLRVTLSGRGEDSMPGVNPPASSGGPATFAERRELLQRAMQALDTLPERDRKLVAAMNEGRSVAETAEELGLGEAAAQRARLRAMERFQRAFRVLS